MNMTNLDDLSAFSFFAKNQEDFKLLSKWRCDSLCRDNSFSSSASSHQLLCLVGEAFDDYSDDVCGAVVNVRTKGDKIAVWTSDYENREAVTHIGWGRSDRGLFKYSKHWRPPQSLTLSFRISTGEFTRNAWGFPWRWLLVTSLMQTPLPKAVQPPRTNLLFEKPLMCLFSFSCLILLLVHMFTLLQKTLRNAIWKEIKSSCQMLP